jgi:hypothetical protein
MLDIVFSVWMRTGSYPTDSNEYEKTFYLINFKYIKTFTNKTTYITARPKNISLLLNLYYLINKFASKFEIDRTHNPDGQTFL